MGPTMGPPCLVLNQQVILQWVTVIGVLVYVAAHFDGFGGSEEHLALLLLVLQNIVPKDSFDGFGGFGGCDGSGRDGYPP